MPRLSTSQVGALGKSASEFWKNSWRISENGLPDAARPACPARVAREPAEAPGATAASEVARSSLGCASFAPSAAVSLPFPLPPLTGSRLLAPPRLPRSKLAPPPAWPSRTLPRPASHESKDDFSGRGGLHTRALTGPGQGAPQPRPAAPPDAEGARVRAGRERRQARQGEKSTFCHPFVRRIRCFLACLHTAARGRQAAASAPSALPRSPPAPPPIQATSAPRCAPKNQHNCDGRS